MANIAENNFRADLVRDLMEYLNGKGEDCGLIKSNVFNMPCVIDGADRWVSVTVTIEKAPKDDDGSYANAGYIDRDFYTAHVEEMKAKAKKQAEEKARKIERDKAERERKKAEKLKAIEAQKEG